MADSTASLDSLETGIQSLNIKSLFERIFNEKTKITAEHQSQLLDQLVKASQHPDSAKELREILLDDAETFLRGLQMVDDSRALTLINVLGVFEARNDLLKNLLNTLKLIIANKDEDTKFFVSVYVAVISNFDHLNYQHLHLFLTLLNPSRNDYTDLSSLILLIVIKCLSKHRSQSVEIIQDVLENYSDDSELDIPSFLNFVNILSTLFPIVPEVTTPIYINEKTKTHIYAQISRIVVDKKLNLDYPNYVLIATELLKLVSSSCITEESRTYNSKNYFDLLQTGATVKGNMEIKLLSSLALVKVWSFVQLDKNDKKTSFGITEITNNFLEFIKEYRKSPNTTFLEYSAEGLAYLSLNKDVKQLLRSDEDFLIEIKNVLQRTASATAKDLHQIGSNKSLTYGLVTIISNLSALKEAGQTNKRTLNYLKSVATPGAKESEEGDQQAIQLFNKSALMNHKIIEVLTQLKTYKEDSVDSSPISPNNLVNQVVFIIYQTSKSQERQVRNELVKQGGLTFILSFLVKHSVIQKNATGETRPIGTDATLIETRLYALRALSKILISVNPGIAFTKYDVRTAVPFLLELLGPDITQYTGTLNETKSQERYLHEMTNLDKYESLLALTNLSSDEQNSDLRKLIIAKSFDSYLNNFIIDSDNFAIQKASWELITNLIVEPSLLVKFFNIEPDNSGKINEENLNRLTLLIKLLNAEEESFQIVIAGLLANATSEFEPIPQIIVKSNKIKEELVSIIIEILLSQAKSEDLILRIGHILLNLVYSSSDLSTEDLDWFNHNEELKFAIASVVRQNKNRDVLEVLLQVLKMIR